MKAAGDSWALLSPDGVYHKLCEPNFFVGREDDMDLTLKSRSVDKQHAVISVNEETQEYKLHDLGTLNGTFVNEVRVKKQPVKLQLRDNVRFGYDFNTFRVELCSQPKKRPIFDDERQLHNGDRTHSLESFWGSKESLQGPVNERKLSIQSSAHQSNSDEDEHHAVLLDQGMLSMYQGVPHSPPSPSQFHPYPHYPYVAPMYHHHPPVMCHCPSCTGHRSPVHSPHGVPHHLGPHAGWPGHASPTTFQVRPRLQRPLSVSSGEKLKMMVKGSPLYGQPPWWGWGSSDDEIYNYPNTATIPTEGDSQTVPGQQALAVRRKKMTKKDALEMAQRRHSVGAVSVLSESKASIITTRTSKTTYHPEQDRTLKQPAEFGNYQKKASLASPEYSDQLSPVFENSTSRDWEMPNARSEKSEWSPGHAECDSSLENSPDDSSEGHSRPSSYEIPFIPGYGEIPERPVSQKSEKGILKASQDDVHSSALDKQDRTSRKKLISKVKKRTGTPDVMAKSAGRNSVSRKHSSDTSESECEPSLHPSRRSGVVTKGTPSSNRVFGLTEVSLPRGRDGDRGENLPPAPLPNWVQQWANSVDNRDNSLIHQPIEVIGSSSATEDSAVSDSLTSSSSHIPVPVQPESSETKTKLVKTDTSSRPRTAPSRTNPPSVTRSQSLSPASMSSTPKTTASSRVARSKTISAAMHRRSYPMGSGNDVERKTTEVTRRRGLVSSTSDDSDVESSDTSGTRQTKDARGKNDESERRGVQLIPEKEGKRPLTVPRPNKTAILRAHNSREAVKNSGVKSRTSASTLKSKTAKNTSSNSTGNGGGVATNDASAARVWTPSTRSSIKSSSGDDNYGETGVPCVLDDDVTQREVDELFDSSPVHTLPKSLQMKRDNAVNLTFVLDEGKGDTSVSSPEDSSTQVLVKKASSRENLIECKSVIDENKSISSPSKELEEIKLESTNTEGISLHSKLIPFAPVLDSPPRTPPEPDHPFEPPNDSPDDMSGGSRCSTGEGRSISSESAVSAPLPASPSPPLTPNSIAKKTFDFKLGVSPSQSRRQWGVTDKPVEDLMLSSIHAFSVELRLASESVLSKVKTLYDGSEELNETARSRTDSDSKEESPSAIPDWKSSHAEIAGIFRNLRKVELRLRTMEQALSIMCAAAQKEPKQQRKLSMTETSSLVSGQKWREFKLKARRNSWAVEHRNQFPVPTAESDEEDEDTP